MTILYFTSTGNSLAVAKQIGGELLSIPQMIKEQRYDFEDDEIGIIVPVYAFDVPKIVKDYLEKVNIKAQYTFAIATCGGMDGATLPHLSKLFTNKGINLDYFASIKMIDNYLPFYDMSNIDKQAEKLNIDESIKAIANDIIARKTKKAKPALIARGFVKVLGPVLALQFDGSTAQKAFTVNKRCTLCGVCQKVCPTKNITVTNEVKFGKNCSVCLGCLHHCPTNAIHMKQEKSGARYINKNVTLNEIINANSQF